MKTFFSTILLSCLSMAAISQSKVGEDRQTILPYDFQEYDRSKREKRVTNGQEEIETAPVGARFTIIDETTIEDSYIIYFWTWQKDSARQKALNFEEGSTTEIKYFTVLKSRLDVVSKRIYRMWSPTIGALTFPFKYRPQNGKFETTFGIGVTGGVTWNPWRTNEHTFSLLGGISASSARVDQYSTDPAANVTDPSERTSVTFSLGIVYQWERLQIGVSAGIDNLLDNEILKWRYQGKPWLTVGIGIGLFAASEITTPGKN